MGKLKLGVKLIVYITMLLALSMIFIGMLTFYRSKSELLEKVKEKLQVINDHKVNKIEEHFGELSSCFELIEKDKELLSNISSYINAVNDPSSDSSGVISRRSESFLTNRLAILRQSFGFSRISIVTSKGRKILETNSIHYLDEYDIKNFNPGSKLFINSKHQLSYSEIYQPRFHENEYYVSALYPLKYQNNITMCVIACEMDLKPLFDQVSDTTGLGATGESFITKRLINDSKVSILSPLRNQYDLTKQKSFDIGDKIGQEVQASVSNTNNFFKAEIKDHRGENVDVVSSYIDELDWGVVTKINHNESFKVIDDLRNWTIFLCCLIIFFSIIVIAIFVKKFLKTILEVRNNMVSLALGDFPEEIEYDNYDEIYDTVEAMNEFVHRIQLSTEFAQKLGKGEIEDETVESELGTDVLSKSLIEMRKNLSKIEENNRKKEWATEGIAKHGEVLRNNSTSITQLGKALISSLVDYVGAHHGGLFAITDLSKDVKPSFELVATYAYEIDETKNTTFELGQGLIGQCAAEGDVIHMTNTPESFSKISSGLGNASARSVLIVPLKLNDVVYGVLEIASFKVIEPYTIEFVQKLGESVASSILSVRTSEQTQKLLDNSESIANNLKQKEEELKEQQFKVQEEQELLKEEFKKAQSTILKLKKEKKELQKQLKDQKN